MVRNLSSLALPLMVMLLSWVLLSRVTQLTVVQQELVALSPYLMAGSHNQHRCS